MSKKVLLLLYCVFLNILLLPLDILSLKFEGACKERCDKQRPLGQKEAFMFDCKEEGCLESCESCPKEVCDETVEESYKWHCPSEELSIECQKHCNKNRPNGDINAYDLTCDKDYFTDAEVQNCRSQCVHCPDFVCPGESGNVFHCPYDKFDGECKLQCDKARKMPESADYQEKEKMEWLKPVGFSCSSLHKDDNDAAVKCKKTCREKCPPYVCDGSVNEDDYKCPMAEHNEECRTFCGENPFKPQSKFFTKSCSEKTFEDSSDWEAKCKALCDRCADSDGHNIACDKPFVSFEFYCPATPFSPTPVAKPSYKGACKERCEFNQGGGFHPYTLNCSSNRYKTEEEKNRCRQDCKECPQDICNDSEDANSFKCPGLKKEIEEEQKKLEKEKRDQEENEGMIRHSYELQKQEMIMWIAIAVGILLLLVGIVFVCRKLRKKPQVANAEIANAPIQQNQPQFQPQLAVSRASMSTARHSQLHSHSSSRGRLQSPPSGGRLS